MPVRNYCLAEAKGIIAANVEKDLQAFTETEWLLSVLAAMPDFATRAGHHLNEAELVKLEKELRTRIANR
jgi:hypothetical protein